MLEMVLLERADAVIGFRADPELLARIEELARKSTEGKLTEDERAEYAGYVRANKFVAILKRQAQLLANSNDLGGEGMLRGEHSPERPSSFVRRLQRRRKKLPQDAA